MTNNRGTRWNFEEYGDFTNSGIVSRSRYWNTREGDVRKKLLRMTKAKENISFVYRECLRSMLSQFSDIVYFNEEGKAIDIKTIYANPERAIAKLTQENNIILPVISISQTISKDDDNRRRNKSVLIHEKLWDAEKKKAYRVLSFSPRAIDIDYEVNIWCKYRSDIDQILEQIRLLFNPELEVPTRYSTMAKAIISAESDAGALVAGDKEDRLIRKKINVTLRTYIPSPKFLVTATGEIEEFNVELYNRITRAEVKPSNPRTDIPDFSPPPVPQNLQVLEGDSFLDLDWNAVVAPDLAGYKLYKSTIGPNSGFFPLETLGKESLSYSDSDVENNQTYYYAITSFDDSGNESEKSNVVEGTPESKSDSDPPPPPQQLEQESGDGTVLLTWKAPEPFPDDFLGYRVERAIAGNNPTFIPVGSLQQNLNYFDNSVVNNRTYLYRVRTVDTSQNKSGPSNVVTATPEETLNAPQGLFGVPGDGLVSLTWNESTQTSIYEYQVYISETGNTEDFQVTGTTLHPVTNFQVTGLTNETPYYFAIKSAKENGETSEFSNIVQITPTDQVTEFANFIVEFSINQRYQNTDPEDSVQIGEVTNKLQTFSVNVASNNLDTQRDDYGGFNTTPWRYEYCQLQDSWVSSTPTWNKAGVTYTTRFDPCSIEQNFVTYNGFVSNHKALSLHACAVKHDEAPDSFEVNVVIGNSYQHNGNIYAQTENNPEGDWSFRIRVKDPITGNVLGEESFEWGTYLMPAQGICRKFYINDTGDFLKNYHHYDPLNKEKVIRPDLYVPAMNTWTQKFDDMSHYEIKAWSFGRQGFPRKNAFANSFGGGGITPYYEWRKGYLAYRWWHREMLGRFYCATEFKCRRSTGEPLTIRDVPGKNPCNYVYDHPGADTGLEYTVRGNLVDRQWYSTLSPMLWTGAGYNQVAEGIGSNLDVKSSNYAERSRGSEDMPVSIAKTLNNLYKEQDNSLYYAQQNLVSFLDDNIFNSDWMFDQVPNFAPTTAQPDQANRPIREMSQWTHTQAGATHKTRDYRAAAALARKCMLARFILKHQFADCERIWSQPNISPPASYLSWGLAALAQREKDFNNIANGASFAQREYHQPARMLSKIKAINDSIQNPNLKIIEDVYLTDLIKEWLKTTDVILHPYKGMHKQGGDKALRWFYLTYPYLSENGDSGGEWLPEAKEYMRGFQVEIGWSLFSDIERGNPGNFGDIADTLTSFVDPEKTIKQRMLESFAGWKEKFGRIDRATPDHLSWHGFDYYLDLMDQMREKARQYGPILTNSAWATYLSPLVPSDVESFPGLLRTWSTKYDWMSAKDRLGVGDPFTSLSFVYSSGTPGDFADWGNMDPLAMEELRNNPGKNVQCYDNSLSAFVPEGQGLNLPFYSGIDDIKNAILRDENCEVIPDLNSPIYDDNGNIIGYDPLTGPIVDTRIQFYRPINSTQGDGISKTTDFCENQDNSLHTLLFIGTDGADRYYHNNYQDAAVFEQTVRNITKTSTGYIDTDQSLSGFNDSIGWTVVAGDGNNEGYAAGQVVNILDHFAERRWFPQSQGPLWSDNTETFDSLYPGLYEQQTRPLSEFLDR